MKRQTLFVILLVYVAISLLTANAVFFLCQRFNFLFISYFYLIFVIYCHHLKETYSVSFGARRLEKQLKSKGINVPRLTSNICDNILFKSICDYIK